MDNTRSDIGDSKALYVDCIRETRPNGAWGEFAGDSQCTVMASRRRADHLCSTARGTGTTPYTKLTYSTSGPLSYTTLTEWESLSTASARAHCDDCAPTITQDILRRYPKLLYSRTCENGPVKWIVVAVSGLRVPEARYSPLSFLTSVSRVVGFVVDRDRQYESRNCVVILDY
jgi:hypothetical protein